MKIRIISAGVSLNGRAFANLTEGSEHEVVEPPKAYKDKYPNGEGSVWVMGVGEPVRIFTKGPGKEAIIIKY